MKKRGFSIVAGPMLFWILGLLALVMFFVLVFVLKGKAEGAMSFIKGIFRFSR